MYVLTSLSMNLFYKYCKTKVLNFFIEIILRLLITCKRDIKVHRASLLKWQSCDLSGKWLVEVSAGFWPVGLRFSYSQLLEGNSEILLQITSRPLHCEAFQIYCSVITLPFHSVLLTNYPTISLYIIHQLSLTTLPFHFVLFTNYPTRPLDNIHYLSYHSDVYY